MTVSESTAPSSISALVGLGSSPFWRKRSTTSVAVEPTGSKVAVTGNAGLDRTDVVVVEDLDDLGLADPITLCACSAWSTSTIRRRGGATRSERVISPTGRWSPSIATAPP